MTLGNQKWKGAAPVFISIEEQIIKKINSLEKEFVFIRISIIINEKINIAEASAWVKKYFKEDSDENKFFVLIIRGIKDNKLISNPIHIPNQEDEEIEIRDPVIIDKKKIIL